MSLLDPTGERKATYAKDKRLLRREVEDLTRATKARQGRPSNAMPLPYGTASAGTGKEYAREDHAHPGGGGSITRFDTAGDFGSPAISATLTTWPMYFQTSGFEDESSAIHVALSATMTATIFNSSGSTARVAVSWPFFLDYAHVATEAERLADAMYYTVPTGQSVAFSRTGRITGAYVEGPFVAVRADAYFWSTVELPSNASTSIRLTGYYYAWQE